MRFSRWLIGFPSGPITVGGRELFAEVPVGCYLPREQVSPRTVKSHRPAGCDDYVYLDEMPKLHPPIKSSRGILRGDFGLSSVILKDRRSPNCSGAGSGPPCN